MPKVLIVDDERQILSSITRLLKNQFEVFTAENIDQAFEVLNAQEIDAVVSDYNLNNSSTGSDLLDSIADKWPHITRLKLTG